MSYSDCVVRVRLDIAYDGSAFAGWAAQPGQRTVQGILEAALDLITGAGAGPLTVAGRTDAGVHARGQVAHVDMEQEAWERLPGRSGHTPAEALLDRLAGVLPPDVVVLGASELSHDFDARFSACGRAYSYRMVDSRTGREPLTRGFTVWHPQALDVDAMALAAIQLLGEHDFLPFCRPRVGASTVRTLRKLDVTRDESGVIIAAIEADAFCHHMVRMLLGALTVVGEGRRGERWPAEVLAAGVHDSAVPVLPAHGLVLERVDYPPEEEWGSRAALTRTVRGPLHGFDLDEGSEVS